MFKSGDKVRCITDTGSRNPQLTKDQIYTVEKCSDAFAVPEVYIKEAKQWYFAKRFEKVEENQMFEPGDKVRCINNAANWMHVGYIGTVGNPKDKNGLIWINEKSDWYKAEYFDKVEDLVLTETEKQMVLDSRKSLEYNKAFNDGIEASIHILNTQVLASKEIWTALILVGNLKRKV
jgi:hypothetical protein